MISKSCDISSDREQFNKARRIYNEAVKNSGFNETFRLSSRIPKSRYRERNIILFNPPFSSNIKANVGK